MRLLKILVLSSICSAAESSLVLPTLGPSVEALLNVSGASDSRAEPRNPYVGSTPPPTPPSNLRVSYAVGRDALSVAACFINSLSALEAMALLDGEDHIMNTEGYQMPGFTETRIEVVPVGERLERRFAIWGVYLGISEMWSRNLFLSTTITLSWNGEAVGNIIFKLSQQPSTGTASLERRSESPSLHYENPTEFKNATGRANITADEPRCLPRFAPIGTGLTMDFHDMIFPIMASLVELSAFPSSARLDHEPDHVYRRDWFRLLQGFNGRIFLFERPRGEPPYLEYGDLIITLVKLVWYMVEALRCGPTSIGISVDGVEVGAGTFLKRGMAQDPNLDTL